MADDERYDIIVSTQVRRALSETLPLGVATAIFEFIDGPLATGPQRVGAPLRAPFDGCYRARRGPYRIRYSIDEEARIVAVVSASHHQGPRERTSAMQVSGTL